jgi:hypothetical protein
MFKEMYHLFKQILSDTGREELSVGNRSLIRQGSVSGGLTD